jgi:hypothetical protein
MVCLAGVAGLAGQAAPAPSQGADQAAKVLADAREALGGEKKLAAVKNFVATGRTRQVRGENLVPIEFEIAVELPDKYVRKDEVPAQESEPTSSGFSGDSLIQIPPPAAPQTPAMPGARPGGAPPAAAPPGTPPPGAAGGAAPGARAMPPGGRPGGPAGPPPDPRKARVTSLKQDFVKLTLGMFATSFPAYPLTFTFVGQAEAPQGKADVIDVKAAPNFALRLFVNNQTHLPIMVSWQVPVTNVTLHVTGTPAPANLPAGAVVADVPPAPDPSAPQADKDKYAKDVQDIRRKALAAAPPTEYRIYYADYRDVGGMQFPFRLRRAVGAETVEETNFDGFKINTKIDPRKFEVVK